MEFLGLANLSLQHGLRLRINAIQRLVDLVVDPVCHRLYLVPVEIPLHAVEKGNGLRICATKRDALVLDSADHSGALFLEFLAELVEEVLHDAIKLLQLWPLDQVRDQLKIASVLCDEVFETDTDKVPLLKTEI